MNVYITSMNKGSGKTVISSGITAVMQSLGYPSGLYKPVQIGAIDQGKYMISPDLSFTKTLDPYITTHCTYMTANTNLPELNSTLKIDLQEIARDYSILTKKAETVIVEAPASLMTPLTEEIIAYQIPKCLKLPVVLVVNPNIDCLGTYQAEIYAAKSLGVDIKGVIINKYQPYSESDEMKAFPDLIEKYCEVKVLGIIKNFKGKTVLANTLITEILNGIDLENLFDIKIPKLNVY